MPTIEGLREGWEKPGAAGLRPHDRRPVPLGERALGHPPGQGCAEGRLVSPPFRGPQGVSRRPAGLAPVRRGRLAGRRLGQRPEGRRARGGIHAVRGRHLRRGRARRRKRPGRPRVRPDRPGPADRQAGRLVHAQLGDLADGLARGAAEDLHRRTSAISHRASSRRRSTFTVDAGRARRGEVPGRPQVEADPNVEQASAPFEPRLPRPVNGGGKPTVLRRARVRRSASPSSGPPRSPTSTT